MFIHRRGNSSTQQSPRLPVTSLALDALENSAVPASAGILLEIPPLMHRDVPLLSVSQVGLICERMIAERVEQLQEEYDKALTDMLNGAYYDPE